MRYILIKVDRKGREAELGHKFKTVIEEISDNKVK